MGCGENHTLCTQIVLRGKLFFQIFSCGMCFNDETILKKVSQNCVEIQSELWGLYLEKPLLTLANVFAY